MTGPVSVGHCPIETSVFKVICRWGGVNDKRTWNNPTREPWNPVIHNILKAIDNHNVLYFQTQDPWHLEKAALLREYVEDLKDWVLETEKGLQIHTIGYNTCVGDVPVQDPCR